MDKVRVNFESQDDERMTICLSNSQDDVRMTMCMSNSQLRVTILDDRMTMCLSNAQDDGRDDPSNSQDDDRDDLSVQLTTSSCDSIAWRYVSACLSNHVGNNISATYPRRIGQAH